MTAHNAWLRHREQNTSTALTGLALRSTLYGLRWYRYAIAGASIVAGMSIGWLLVTRQWEVWQRPGLYFDETADEAFLYPIKLIGTALFPFILGTLVSNIFKCAALGRVTGGVLFLLMLTNLLSPALGCLLMILGLFGAVAALGGLEPSGPAEEAGVRPEPAHQLSERELDDADLAALARLAASSELTETMREHVLAIHAAASAALPRLRLTGLPTPALLTARTAVNHHVPDTLRNYLRLPAEFRMATLADGKSVQSSTEWQLDRMRLDLEAVLRESVQPELNAILVQDAFVEARFATAQPLSESSHS